MTKLQPPNLQLEQGLTQTEVTPWPQLCFSSGLMKAHQAHKPHPLRTGPNKAMTDTRTRSRDQLFSALAPTN